MTSRWEDEPSATNDADKLRAEFRERLAMSPDQADPIAAAYARGVADERARVVKWLDGTSAQYESGDMVPHDDFEAIARFRSAREIERGEHEEKP